MYETAKDALLYYGINRTNDGKGVTIASQKRYVYYYEYIIRRNIRLNDYPAKRYFLERVHFFPKPTIGGFSAFGRQGLTSARIHRVC